MIEPRQIDKCLAMQERAKVAIPGMTQLLSKRPDIFSKGVWPTYYERAKGAEVWDLDGNHYYDFSICGIGATVLGFADPEVDEAVKQAIVKGQACSLNCPEEVELAERMCQLHPWAEMARFTRSGGEAMAVAVRIARAASGKDKVAFCGYHGWHDWYLAANLAATDALADHLLEGLSCRGVPRQLIGTALPFHYNDVDEFDALMSEHGDEVGVIVMEVWRSQRPAPGFLERIREVASQRGIVLVFDEISSAFRLNCGGVHMVCTEVRPDVAVFSKALGNGYPIGAVIGSAAVMQAAQDTFISSTTWTERVGFSAALALLAKYERESVHEHIGMIGGEIVKIWQELGDKHGLELHTAGLAPAPHFDLKVTNFPAVKAYFVQLMVDQGFLASNLCYCTFSHQVAMLSRYAEAVDFAFGEIVEALADNELPGKLRGAPAASTFERLT